MKPIKYIGAALVAAAALGFVACNNDSVNAPDFSGSNSSAVEQRNQQTSSSSFAKREPGSSGDVALSSDEKIVTQSSSSVAISSSGKTETCKHVTDIVCEPCPPGEKCSCHPCDSNKEFESRDCSTGVELHCENGEWLRGDVGGILCSIFLGAQELCIPVSCNTAAEKCGLFRKVRRTRIGSPYVISEMIVAEKQDSSCHVVGYEANGGFLLQTSVLKAAKKLVALPTRDALIYLLGITILSKQQGMSLSQLVAKLPQRYTYSDRLQNFSQVEFYIIKILNISGAANSAILAASLDFVTSIDVDIVAICASLLVKQDNTEIHELCKKIYDSGKIMLISVRNKYLTSEPACYPTVIGVIGDVQEETNYSWCSDYQIQMKCSAKAVIVKELFGCRNVFQGNSKATALAVAIVAKLMYQHNVRGIMIYPIIEKYATEHQFKPIISEDSFDIINREPFDAELEDKLIQTEDMYQRFLYCLCEFFMCDDPQEIRNADLLELSERKMIRKLECFLLFIQERFKVKLDFLELDNLRFAYLFYLNYIK